MTEDLARQKLERIITANWPWCQFGTELGKPDQGIGGTPQAFITRGPFTDMGAPTGEPGSFYVWSDGPDELSALILAFGKACMDPAARASMHNPGDAP